MDTGAVANAPAWFDRHRGCSAMACRYKFRNGFYFRETKMGSGCWSAIGFIAGSFLSGTVIAADGPGVRDMAELPYARNAIAATGYQGNMLIYDMNSDRYLVADANTVNLQHIPASTFKVVSSLVALQSGVVADADTVLPWDGIIRGRQETNTDMSLRDAFRLSSVPHYQALLRALGEDTMQSALTAVAYGNENIGGGIDQFWLTGALRISLWQQIDVLRRLYNEELPFSVDNMRTVKDIMLVDATDDYIVRAKTGLAVLNGNRNTGWWVGWVERGDNVTLFATVLTATAPGSDFIPARLAVTRDVLNELEVLP